MNASALKPLELYNCQFCGEQIVLLPRPENTTIVSTIRICPTCATTLTKEEEQK